MLFINALDEMRVDLKKRLNKEIDGNEFVRDILSKLPEVKKRGQMTPYQVEKRLLIEAKVQGASVTYGVGELIIDLEKV